MRKRFYELLSESVNKKDNFYLTNEQYNTLLSEMKDAKTIANKKSVHYKCLKRYDVLNIRDEEKLIAQYEGKEEILYYVCFNELFKVIEETHIAIGHGGQTLMIMELNRKYRNVTVLNQ